MPGIVFRKTTDLALYSHNARTHSPEQIEQIAGSIEEFGWTFPILADSEGIVAGHGRLAAAGNLYAQGKQLRMMPTGPDAPAALIPPGHVPVMDCSGWTPAQRRTYILADNKIALNAGWDNELLRHEFAALMGMGVDLDTTGFSLEERELILEPLVLENQRDPDAAPPLPDEPHSVPGDVWILGEHKVVCGDSCSVDNWQKLMGQDALDAVWTDPPYNVNIEAKNKMLDRADGGSRAKSGGIQNDAMGSEEFLDFLRGMYACLFTVMKPGAAIYVAHADTEGLAFRRAFAEAGFKLSGCLVWKKETMVLGRSDYQWIHEPILYGWKPGARHRWFGGRKNTTVQDMGADSPFVQQADGSWSVKVGEQYFVVQGDAKVIGEAPSSVINMPRPKKSAEHPTMKPVALVERNLRFSARTGYLVGDAFGGSGTTLIACERLGMRARISELSPKYTDVIVRRWQNYTGRVAVLEGTDKPFPVPPDISAAF